MLQQERLQVLQQVLQHVCGEQLQVLQQERQVQPQVLQRNWILSQEKQPGVQAAPRSTQDVLDLASTQEEAEDLLQQRSLVAMFQEKEQHQEHCQDATFASQ